MPEIADDVARVHGDVVRLFGGQYPGYCACNTGYHTLEHTCGVFLAAARLAHGAVAEGEELPARVVRLLLTCALFHDAGFLQTEDDTTGTGAKYTVGHEARSAQLLEAYLTEGGAFQNLCPDQCPDECTDDCSDGAQLIACTNMAQPVGDIPFRTLALALAGRMLGVANIYAQMADRAYLEKLFLLHREREEAGVTGLDSEFTLLEKTEGFYERTIKRRLAVDLGGAGRYMRSHFVHRHGLDADPYEEAIQKNINYLRLVLEETRRIYRERFRRGGMVW